MKHGIVISLRMALVTLVLTGVVYPLAVTGIAKVLFPGQAAGSMVSAGGRTVGSSLIAQPFVADGYFHPRPSASGHDAMASGPSNLGPTSARLFSEVTSRVADVVRANPGAVAGAVPVDLVTSSGSGLDPHISPDAAYLQVRRVAAARGLEAEIVGELVGTHVTPRQLGFLGEPRVNVLELNLALDEMEAGR